MATSKQVKFFNTLKKQGRPSRTDAINDLSVREAWKVISSMLKQHGDAEAYNDEDYNNEMVRDHDEYHAKEAQTDKMVQKQVIDDTLKQEGGTYNPVSLTRQNYTTGYMVGSGKNNKQVKKEELTPQLIKDYVDSQLESGYELGTWYDKEADVIHLDNSKKIENLEEAKKLAKERNEKAIWDNANFDEISTGGTGVNIMDLSHLEEKK